MAYLNVCQNEKTRVPPLRKSFLVRLHVIKMGGAMGQPTATLIQAGSSRTQANATSTAIRRNCPHDPERKLLAVAQPSKIHISLRVVARKPVH